MWMDTEASRDFLCPLWTVYKVLTGYEGVPRWITADKLLRIAYRFAETWVRLFVPAYHNRPR